MLDALKSYKLDDVKVSKKFESLRVDDMQVYFAKYLTSPKVLIFGSITFVASGLHACSIFKLLDLQLNDSNFRRQILIQFLILFKYANSEVKFKT